MSVTGKPFFNTWKSLELGAKALVEPGESPEEAEDKLYEHLTLKFRQLWAKRTGLVQKCL
jgi:hypothetical protein